MRDDHRLVWSLEMAGSPGQYTVFAPSEAVGILLDVVWAWKEGQWRQWMILLLEDHWRWQGVLGHVWHGPLQVLVLLA